MAETTPILLTIDQAVDAICLDFRGYDPQPMLFCEVLRTVHGGRLIYKRESGQAGLWISGGHHGKMQWLEGKVLIDYMCDTVTDADLAAADLAVLCGKVFQAPCRAVPDPKTGRTGIEVRPDMTGFSCKQCGRCCSRLDYHSGVTSEDVARLGALGRTDVLKWIGRGKDSSGRMVYRMWVAPETRRPVSGPCPFLKQGDTNEHHICTIHDVKPTVCRNYPLSRKHAVMTGCPGFE